MADMTLTREQIEALTVLAKAATAGPWRAHDHRDMALYGENPDEWIGYAWVGHKGEEDGRFQAKIADLDARKDASQPWREQRHKDAAFIAASNPATVLSLIEMALQAPQFQPAPAEAREWWINFYDHGVGYAYHHERDAERDCGDHGLTIHVREVTAQPPPPSDVVDNKVWNAAIEAAATEASRDTDENGSVDIRPYHEIADAIRALKFRVSPPSDVVEKGLPFEIEKWFITIKAHCTCIDDACPSAEVRELTDSIRLNVFSARAAIEAMKGCASA